MEGKNNILTVANGVTFFRLILFGGFLWYLFQKQLAAAGIFFLLAWAIDGIDGFIARSLNQESSFGFYLDKVIDRIILIAGLVALVLTGYVPAYGLFLLTKDILLIPVLFIHAHKKQSIAGLGIPGKVMTFLQGLGILWLILTYPLEQYVVVVVAVAGALVALLHLKRVLRS